MMETTEMQAYLTIHLVPTLKSLKTSLLKQNYFNDVTLDDTRVS